MVDTFFFLTRIAGALLSFLCVVFSFLSYRNVRRHGVASYSRVFLTGKKCFIMFGTGGLAYVILSLLGVILHNDAVKYLAYPALMLMMFLAMYRFYRITKF